MYTKYFIPNFTTTRLINFKDLFSRWFIKILWPISFRSAGMV